MMHAQLVILLSLVSFTLMANPNRPDLPERPQTPAERQIERQAERQLERALRQLENLPERLPEPAALAIERASERLAERQLSGHQHSMLPAEAINLARMRTEVTVEHGFDAIEREWVLLVTPDERALLEQEAAWLFDYLVEEQYLAALGSQMITLLLPAELDSYQALAERLLAAKPQALDRNHIFRPQGGDKMQAISQSAASDAATREQAICSQPVSLGLIDTAIQLQHPYWQQSVQFQSQSFVAADQPQPLAHGTAVASRLVQQFDEALTLHHAAVFYQDEQQRQGTSLLALLQALDWLAQQQVQVINMSLTGPDNQALHRAIRQLWQGSTYLVAAVGNAGPHAGPLYPAAYPEVLAVTAVDSRLQPYRWAVQGEHLAFAAHGEQVVVADSNGAYRVDSGTSLAAPVAAAWLACTLVEQPDYQAALVTLKQLAIRQDQALKNTVFGYGILPGRLLLSETGLQ